MSESFSPSLRGSGLRVLCQRLTVLDMFEPKHNPGYQALLKDATSFVAKWTRNEWYESSSETVQEAAKEAVA